MLQEVQVLLEGTSSFRLIIVSYKAPYSYNRTGLIALLLLLISAGCDRAFVPPTPPSIEIVSPSPDRAYLNDSAVLEIRASSFREIDRVELDGRVMRYDPTRGSWIDTLALAGGLNAYEITAYDEDDIPGSELLSLLRMAPEFSSSAPGLPESWRIGGHSATLLEDGSVFVLGGSPALDQLAQRQAYILNPGAEQFEIINRVPIYARIGHTANLLPDGRVLIVGGATLPIPNSNTHLQPTAEIYDPQTGRFKEVPFSATPVERAYHTAFVTLENSGVFLDLHGGLGRQREFIDETTFGTRGDFRTFRFRNDSLISFTSTGTTIAAVEDIFGQASSVLEPASTNSLGSYIVTGTNFGASGNRNDNFVIDFTTLPISIENTPLMNAPRTLHAAAGWEPGVVFFFGGRENRISSVLNTSEIYINELNRFFLFSNAGTSIRRFSHTATKLNSGRILILGGFTPNGNAVGSGEYFDPGFTR